ncbi:3-ketodihydrosphingosine reductase [Cucumispora dikerogammari]|nr:3-ketodihydrosphingosine reductase [Cucumispora dikerogammari]
MLYKYLTLLFLLLTYSIFEYIPILKNSRVHKPPDTANNILIIGGTSGLGLALAINLQSKGYRITIAARNKQNLISIAKIHNFKHLTIDICKDLTVSLCYDYIICTAGLAITGLFKDLTLEDFKRSTEINYFGPINLINAIKHQNFISKITIMFISSTSTLIPIPGYITYSPSKIALEYFVKIANLELKSKNIFLKIFYSNTINTEGFKRENINKPEITKRIESFDSSNTSPDVKAEVIFKNLHKDVSFSDLFTYLVKVGVGCDGFCDLYVLWVGGIVRLVVLLFIKRLC